MNQEIYVIYEDCVWDDEGMSKVHAVSDNNKTAHQLFKDFINKTKDDINFNELNAISGNDVNDYFSHDNEWIVESNEDNFSLFLQGEYNSFHIDISIVKLPLIKEYKKDDFENEY